MSRVEKNQVQITYVALITTFNQGHNSAMVSANFQKHKFFCTLSYANTYSFHFLPQLFYRLSPSDIFQQRVGYNGEGCSFKGSGN